MHCGLEYKLVQPLWETAWQFFKIIYSELSYDLAIPLTLYTQEN